MKKSLLALAALTAFAGAASAQSSVTIGGKLDIAVGKNVGSDDKGLIDNAGSRLNFGIVEDLGGGLKAVAGFEHRFNPDDGTSASASNFWNGYSWVGLQGGFGKVTLGRHYTAAFLMLQNQIDPFGGDTVAGLRGAGMLGAGTAKVRTANSIKYDIAMGGLAFGFDIAEAGKNNAGAADPSIEDKPWSAAVSYSAGPLYAALAYENPGDPDDKLLGIGVRYTMGMFTLRGAYAKGTNASDLDVSSYLIGANMPLGNGDLRVGYAAAERDNVDVSKKFGIGYHYNLSKRTKLFVDVARDGEVTDEKTGYDFGIQHNF